MVEWLRGKNFCTHGGSVFWRGFLQTLPVLGRRLAWIVGDGHNICLGIDLIVGVDKSLSLPSDLLDFLVDLDISSLASARNTLPGPHDYWYSAADLGISGEWKTAWENFTISMERCGLRLVSGMDSLVWSLNS